MLDELMKYLKENFRLEVIEYEGENDEGFYFATMNKQAFFWEFRVSKELNSSSNNKIEKRPLGEKGEKKWIKAGEVILMRVGIRV